MANSLLAHLYSRIRGSQEDVATLALHYLLSQSSILNEAFTAQISSSLGVDLEKSLQYSCQSVGENNERPDMVGKNNTGCEEVVCEMKFYAGLTSNQPLGYIDRIKGNNGKGLVFICPKARQTILWAKILELCVDRKTSIVSRNSITVDGIYMSILSWADVINELERVATIKAREYLPDIFQLKGYCEQMDSDAFIPFESSDLTADNAKRISRYYQVVNEVVNLICKSDPRATVYGNQSTYFQGNDQVGYERKLYVGDYYLTVAYDHALWKSTASVETPFWLSIRDKEKKQTAFIRERIYNIKQEKWDDSVWDTCYLALEALQNATFDEVCEDLKNQIYLYLNYFLADKQ